ncbi:hypothetical protein [Sporisorium scitamineum]|uniref:BHLH domain-containing protein n=1 Tax=Sporisorium scitamineum TaxID=49012 RepID=A0A0F7RYS9_9BASI|nr:hypothetical protein [Sporisorium scitamineum]
MQNSPVLSNNPFPSSSTPNSFMDTFDFGNPDFSTANSGLEDLSIFPSTDPAVSASSQQHNPQSEAGSAPVSHQPSPSAATLSHTGASSDANAPLHSASNSHTAGVYLNSSSHASSPLAFSRNRFDIKSSASPQAASSDHGHNRPPPSAAPSDINFANFADQSRAAPPMQQSHSQNNEQQLSQMPQFSISDLQRMLLERERTERAAGDQSNVLAQYGLITPMGSGPFNSSACPPGQANFMSPLTIQPNSHPGSVGIEHRPGQDYLGNYTPLESPAVTPASVFSTGSTGIVMSELFSPLTSPALGPQPPSLGEMMLPPAQLHQAQHHQPSSQQAAMHGSPAVSAVSNFTPTASPLALIAKGSSKIRKNRSTTAEARANKVRPSPLIKPVAGSSTKKKKDAASLASPSTATPLVNGNGHANGGSSGPGSRRASITAAPESGSATHSRHQSADVQHSEGTSSTPSPIDLSGGGAMPPPSGPTNKILTPSSIMGIRSSPGSAADQRQASSPNNRGSAMKGKARDDLQQQQQQLMMQQTSMGMPAQPAPGGHHVYPNIAPFPSAAQPTAPKVTFNLPPQMSGMPIQPGGLSQADCDAWMSYKSAGGLESRRTSHKAAEQKRRDSLKFCFDELRGLLPAITLDEDAPNGSLLGADGAEEDREAEHFEPGDVGDPEMARSANKAISKVALLRHSNEYLVRMKKRLERRDQALVVCRKQVHELRQKLGLPPSDDPSVTGRGAPLGWTDESMVFELADGQAEADSPGGKTEMDQTA